MATAFWVAIPCLLYTAPDSTFPIVFADSFCAAVVTWAYPACKAAQTASQSETRRNISLSEGGAGFPQTRCLLSPQRRDFLSLR